MNTTLDNQASNEENWGEKKTVIVRGGRVYTL